MRVQKPKGTVDILPDQSSSWQKVEETARNFFNRANYREIRTPSFENYEIFSRSSGDSSEIVEKQMYDFNDKGGRHLPFVQKVQLVLYVPMLRIRCMHLKL